jgi:hypothetical protein
MNIPLPLCLTSFTQAQGLLEELPPGSKLICELRLHTRTHLKVLWLGGFRRTSMMTRDPYGRAILAYRTFLPTFIQRQQLYVVRIDNAASREAIRDNKGESTC